ncbi:hypothetical protein GGF32_008298 [Allomyces javanicus]|nr:hypothetical protein GGF32_008298 [Allomyces javanicus]
MPLSKEFLDCCIIFQVTIPQDANGKKLKPKMPVGWNALTESLPTNLGPDHNYALRAGQISDLTVVDLDKASDAKDCGIEWWERNMYPLEEHPGILVKSTNGYHLYFKYSPDLNGLTGLFGAGVDIRNENNCIFAGKGYTVLKHRSHAQLPPVPDAFLIKYREYTQTSRLANKEDEPPSDQPIDPKLGDIIIDYITKEFADPGQIQIYAKHMTVPLKSRDCRLAGRRHQSNHQYLVMMRDNCIYKCHDEQCSGFIDCEYSDDVLDAVNHVLKPGKDELLTQCDGSDEQIAKCFEAMFESTYPNHKLVALSKNEFYIFNGTRWYDAQDASKELARIFENMKRKFRIRAQKLRAEIRALDNAFDDDDDDDTTVASEGTATTSGNTSTSSNNTTKKDTMVKRMKAQVKRYERCADRCGNDNSRGGIKRVLSGNIRDNEFMERLDTNKKLIAFNDCVLDLTTKETRPSKATDYISKTVGYNYPDYVPREDREYVEDILRKIYPDPEIRTHVLKVFSLSLSGAKGTEKMYFHTGVGANGKSVMNSIMMAVLGQYAVELEAQRFCGGSVSTGAGDAFLVKARGCRYVSISEPRDGCKFDSQTVKMWTSEVISCRQLYSSVVIKLHPNRKLHCFCNAMPSFDGDTGMMRHPEKIPYMSKFKEADQVDEENHVYLMDKSLLNNMDRIVPAMMQILIEHYDDNWNEQAPAIIRNETKEYVEDNNEVGRFLNGVMTRSEDKTDFVLMADLFEQYETHCNMTRKPRPQRGNFKNQLIAFVDAQRHGVFKDKHNTRSDDKVKSVRNVVKGWKLL